MAQESASRSSHLYIPDTYHSNSIPAQFVATEVTGRVWNITMSEVAPCTHLPQVTNSTEKGVASTLNTFPDNHKVNQKVTSFYDRVNITKSCYAQFSQLSRRINSHNLSAQHETCLVMYLFVLSSVKSPAPPLTRTCCATQATVLGTKPSLGCRGQM